MANKATNQLDKLSNNNLFIVLGLVSLLVLGITGFAAKALVGNIIQNGKVIAKQSTAKDNLKTDLDAAPKLITAFKGLGSTAPTISDGLPNSADFAGLLVIMQNVAGNAGVVVQSMAPIAADTSVTSVAAASTDTTTTITGTSTDSTKPPTPQELDFNLVVSGSYANIAKLMTNFETSARPLRVTTAQFAGSGSNITATMTVATYYQDKATLPFGKETVK